MSLLDEGLIADRGMIERPAEVLGEEHLFGKRGGEVGPSGNHHRDAEEEPCVASCHLLHHAAQGDIFHPSGIVLDVNPFVEDGERPRRTVVEEVIIPIVAVLGTVVFEQSTHKAGGLG